MRVKAWDCPACRREFIVAAESTRDRCPWCDAIVEERGDLLRVLVETNGASPASPSSHLTDPVAPWATLDDPASMPGSIQPWWPFEFDPPGPSRRDRLGQEAAAARISRAAASRFGTRRTPGG